MSKINCIGLVGEDKSDNDSIQIIIKKITGKRNLSFKKISSHGCGTLKRKICDYADNLFERKCNLLIITHDQDKENYENLIKNLQNKISPTKFPFSHYLICIPIEEIEAWFLSDPQALRSALNLKKTPNIRGLPESVSNPKEKLEKLVYQYSDKSKVYIHSVDNQKIAEKLSVHEVYKKCKAFQKLYDFITKYNY